jgi:hypothetical protein
MAGGLEQVIESLSNKYEALISNPKQQQNLEFLWIFTIQNGTNIATIPNDKSFLSPTMYAMV